MKTIALFQQLGLPEVLIVLAVALVLFGSKKLPDIGRSLGKGIREFKGGVKGFGDDVRDGMKDDEKPSPAEAKDE